MYSMPKPELSAIGAALVVLVVILVVILGRAGRPKSHYSVGFQIDPEYLGSSTWSGTPYALSDSADWNGQPACPPLAHVSPAPGRAHKDRFYPFAPPDEGPRGTTDPPALIYTPPFTSDLRGDHPNWWRPDGGTYGLPPASDRPDFWAGDATIHTYHARDPIPPLCSPAVVADHRRRMTPEEWVKEWRYYGGPKGWNMSPFY